MGKHHGTFLHFCYILHYRTSSKMCVCVYIYIYIYIYTHSNKHGTYIVRDGKTPWYFWDLCDDHIHIP